MRNRLLSLASALALLSVLVLPLFQISPVSAQESNEPTVLFQVSLDDAVLPPAPIGVRLLRITMQPGSSSPNHTHPGPELWRVESGKVTVRAQGPTIYLKNKSDKPSTLDTNKNEVLGRGDQITFLPGTPFTFANKSDSEVKLLVSVLLPAGHQRPPLISYVDGQPPADAFEGIRSDILGDGLADIVPSGATTVTIDQLDLTQGQSIPAEPNPVLVTVADGSLEFDLKAGCGQVTRTATPAQPTACSPTGQYQLAKGDAIYFPAGMKEATRGDGIADVSIYRLSLVGDENPATPTSDDQVGEIEITGPAAPTATATSPATATSEATAVPTETPTAKPTKAPKPTKTPKPTEAAGKFEVGQTVYVNDTDVRLRDAPTTNSNIVTGLTIGQALTITGESVTADGYTWWPVVSPDDETYTGWVAEEFLSTEPVES